MAYHTFHGLETRIVRIFNTYGPRMRLNDGRALPAFIGQALRGEDLTVFGDGTQTRSFCFVDDMIEGIYRLLLSDITEPVNIGNPVTEIKATELTASVPVKLTVSVVATDTTLPLVAIDAVTTGDTGTPNITSRTLPEAADTVLMTAVDAATGLDGFRSPVTVHTTSAFKFAAVLSVICRRPSAKVVEFTGQG